MAKTGLRPVTVVQGYHYGDIADKNCKYGYRHYIRTDKPFNFRITAKTKHCYRAKVGRGCKVLTRRGEAKLLITKIYQAKGSIAIKFARRLKPVEKFYLFGMADKYLYRILKYKTGIDLHHKKINKTTRNKILKKDRQQRRKYYKKMHHLK